jgi:hypothetical protein
MSWWPDSVPVTASTSRGARPDMAGEGGTTAADVLVSLFHTHLSGPARWRHRRCATRGLTAQRTLVTV